MPDVTTLMRDVTTLMRDVIGHLLAAEPQVNVYIHKAVRGRARARSLSKVPTSRTCNGNYSVFIPAC